MNGVGKFTGISAPGESFSQRGKEMSHSRVPGLKKVVDFKNLRYL